jgi:FixJ family two-component response regulator
LEQELPDRITISIVDDDESVREGMVSLMKSHGYYARSFDSAENFLNSTFRRKTDCLITDMHMPGMTGLELIAAMSADNNSVPSILISARFDEVVRARARQIGAFCYLRKPFSEDELLSCIKTALDSHGRRSACHDT